MNKAFTLLELIIVMSLVAIAATIGILGMTTFRQTVQVNNAAFELLSNFQSYENMARNSVPSLVKPGNDPIQRLPDGYAVFFGQNNYSLHYCDKNGALGQFVCNSATPERANLKIQEYADISMVATGTNAAGCMGILFERKTGLMYSMSDFIAVPQRSGTCTYEIKHPTNLTAKRFEVNLVGSNYTLK